MSSTRRLTLEINFKNRVSRGGSQRQKKDVNIPTTTASCGVHLKSSISRSIGTQLFTKRAIGVFQRQ